MTRAEVFDAVRGALRRAEAAPEWRGARFPARSFEGDRVERFRRELAAVAGDVVGPVSHWGDALEEALGAWGCDEVFSTPGMALPHGVRRATRQVAAAHPAEVIGLARAAWGIAESGSLVLESAGGHLPAVLTESSLVVLPVQRIVWGIEEVPPIQPGVASRVIVTGPARTADIEKRLVLGAHGPRRLRVVLLAAKPDVREG